MNSKHRSGYIAGYLTKIAEEEGGSSILGDILGYTGSAVAGAGTARVPAVIMKNFIKQLGSRFDQNTLRSILGLDSLRGGAGLALRSAGDAAADLAAAPFSKALKGYRGGAGRVVNLTTLLGAVLGPLIYQNMTGGESSEAEKYDYE